MNTTIWRSTLPAVVARPALVDEEVLHAVEQHPSRPAILDGRTGRTVTFAQLADGARRIAGGLRERHVGRGDVVSIVAGNAPDYAVVLYGALAAGAAVANANPALTGTELTRQFAKTRPKLVVADTQSLVAVIEALAATGNAAAVHLLDGEPSVTSLLAPGGPGGVAGRDPSDLAMLFPSSGTTGMPKIAMHTHAGITAWLQGVPTAQSTRVLPGDVVTTPVPFTHLFGSGVLHHSLGSGASVVTMSGIGFDLATFLGMLQDHAVTVAFVTPPLVLALARHPMVDRFDLSSLRLLITSAAPCPPALQDEVEARVGCRVVETIGSTEAWCFAPPADPPVRGSVGRIAANNEAVIVDPDTGARLGPDQPGELWLRGPQVMAGYLGDDEATSAVLERDGWLRTGDLCSFDGHGNLYVVDRLKELIKVGGYSVAPAEVELELVKHPAVADAVVVGRPDPELGEVPVAYVALHDVIDPAELRAWLDGRLAPWKQVREVTVVDQVPRNPAGKLLRRQLIESERSAAAQSVR
jgi:acyl-CoA synthetase (AMP-forming)/AMP-acid ligase II